MTTQDTLWALVKLPCFRCHNTFRVLRGFLRKFLNVSFFSASWCMDATLGDLDHMSSNADFLAHVLSNLVLLFPVRYLRRRGKLRPGISPPVCFPDFRMSFSAIVSDRSSTFRGPRRKQYICKTIIKRPMSISQFLMKCEF